MSNSADAERRRDLVLHDLRPHAAADELLPLLQALDAPQVDADGAVELEGATAGRHLRVAEDDADLLPQLVDEDDGGARAGDGGRQLAHRLRHEARLQAGQGVAHLAFDLGARHQRRHAVDDDDVDGVGADERLGDLQRLLAGVRLRDEEVVDLDAAGGGVGRVEGVLDVDVGSGAAYLLRFGDDVLGERGLAGGLRPEYLRHPAARYAADAEGQVQGDRAGRDRLYLQVRRRLAEAHDGALPELLLDVADGKL